MYKQARLFDTDALLCYYFSSLLLSGWYAAGRYLNHFSLQFPRNGAIAPEIRHWWGNTVWRNTSDSQMLPLVPTPAGDSFGWEALINSKNYSHADVGDVYYEDLRHGSPYETYMATGAVISKIGLPYRTSECSSFHFLHCCLVRVRGKEFTHPRAIELYHSIHDLPCKFWRPLGIWPSPTYLFLSIIPIDRTGLFRYRPLPQSSRILVSIQALGVVPHWIPTLMPGSSYFYLHTGCWFARRTPRNSLLSVSLIDKHFRYQSIPSAHGLCALYNLPRIGILSLCDPHTSHVFHLWMYG